MNHHHLSTAPLEEGFTEDTPPSVYDAIIQVMWLYPISISPVMDELK